MTRGQIWQKIPKLLRFMALSPSSTPFVETLLVLAELRSRPSEPWRNKHIGADIHDPKARTSTILRDFQKLRSEKLWAEFPFPLKVSLPCLFCSLFLFLLFLLLCFFFFSSLFLPCFLCSVSFPFFRSLRLFLPFRSHLREENGETPFARPLCEIPRLKGELCEACRRLRRILICVPQKFREKLKGNN